MERASPASNGNVALPMLALTDSVACFSSIGSATDRAMRSLASATMEDAAPALGGLEIGK